MLWYGNSTILLATKLQPTFKNGHAQRYIEEMAGFVYAISDGADHVISRYSPVMLCELANNVHLNSSRFSSAMAGYTMLVTDTFDGINTKCCGNGGEPGRLPFITLNYQLTWCNACLKQQGISVNDTLFTDDANIDSMPYTFMLRGIAERAETLEQAVAIIKQPAYGWIEHVISDAKIPKAIVVRYHLITIAFSNE